MRNFEKRRAARIQIEALQKARSEECFAAADEIEDDKLYDNAIVAIENKYNPTIDYLILLEFALQFHETRNKWFCDIVVEKGEGIHRISQKQADCFGKYFEIGEYTWKTNDVYCRAAGYFCRLSLENSTRYLKIQKIAKPENYFELKIP